MWTPDDVEITLEESDGATSLVRITTPAAFVDLLGEVSFVGATMRLERAMSTGRAPAGSVAMD